MPIQDPEQRRQYNRDWRAARRAEWFKDKVCAICGSTENLELDHVDGQEKIDHRIWSWSTERRMTELAKCQALCHDCHTVKSNNEKMRGGNHGRSFLKEEDIPAIRSSTEPRKILAERYGVDPETIKSVRARRSWKHVP